MEPPVPPLESPPFNLISPPVSTELPPLAIPPAMFITPPSPPSDSLSCNPAPAEICTLPPLDSRAEVLPALTKTSPPDTNSESLEGEASPTCMTILPPDPPVAAPVST